MPGSHDHEVGDSGCGRVSLNPRHSFSPHFLLLALLGPRIFLSWSLEAPCKSRAEAEVKELTQLLGSYLLSSSSSHLLTPIFSLLLSETVSVGWE